MRAIGAIGVIPSMGVIVVCSLGVLAPCGAGDARTAAQVDAYVQPLIDLGVFQGAVLVARGDDVVVERAYGFANIELGVRNSPEQVFRIASLSKAFTKVALAKLSESGRLDLDAPLSRFVPGYPAAERITIRMLLDHRAGVPSMNSIPYDEEAWEPNTLDSLVQVLAHHPLDFDPGSRQRYSNGGYAILAHVIEKVTGTTYPEFLRREILDPLGLAHTQHEGDLMLVPGRAYGYMPSALERRDLVPAPFQQMATKTGGGSLVSTVGVLHRFLRAAYRDNVIRAATWRALMPLSDSTLAFQGRCPGFNAYMMRDFAHDLDVIVLSNNYASGTIASVAADLAALALGRAPQPPRWRIDVAADSLGGRALTGLYRAPAGALPFGDWPFDLRWRNGDLVLYRDRTPLDLLVPQTDGSFLLRNLCSEVRFIRNPGAKAAQATIKPLWIEKTVTMERVAAGGD